MTTPAAHFDLNKAAFIAGKHVDTEKPLATTFTEANILMDIAAGKGLYLGSAQDALLGSRLQTCRKLIDTGTIGDIVGAEAFVVSHGHDSILAPIT